MSVVESPAVPKPIARPGATLETLLYGALWLLGAALRLGDLGRAPLLPVELASAYPAWLQAMGNAGPLPADSAAGEIGTPLLYALQVVLFWLVGSSDVWARILSACVGTAMLGLPWLVRDRLGRVTALFLTLLLALNPWLVMFSRTADGVIFALFFGLLAMAALERARGADPDAAQGWLQLFAIAAGLLLVSGSVAWSLLPLLALNVIFLGLPPALAAEGRGPGQVAGLLVLGGGAALLGSTVWLVDPAGLSRVATSFGQWLAQVQPLAATNYSMVWVSVRLLTDGALLLVFGAVGLILLGRQDSERARTDFSFLAVWLLWGLLLLIAPGRQPATLVVIQVPLLLTAAYGLALWIGRLPAGIASPDLWVIMASAGAILLSAFFWARILLTLTTFELNTALIIVLLLLALVIVLLSYAMWTDWTRTIWLIGLVLFGLLQIGSTRAMWRLNFHHLTTRPDGFYATTTHPDVRNLAADVATLSALRTGDPGELPLQIQSAVELNPILGWYLRDMRRQVWVLAPGPDGNGTVAPVYVTPAQELTDTVGYLGSDYSVRVEWLPDALFARFGVSDQNEEGDPDLQAMLNSYWSDAVRPLLRWILYREIGSGMQSDDVTLWVVPGQ